MQTKRFHNSISQLLIVAIFGFAAALPTFGSEKFTPESIEFFENEIRPLLAENCFQCHSARSEKLKGGLRLDHRQAFLDGGDSGPALVPGKPDESQLMEAVRYEGLEMPPGKEVDRGAN